MTVIEDIKNIFSILHDGTISAWNGDKELLILTVDCKYLAEKIDKSFHKFYIELFKVDKMQLETWSNLIDIPTIIKTDLTDIFKAKLEILSADIKDEKVVIACNQHDTSFDYCGGNLRISCQTIKVFDQNRNELTIDQFDKICNDYWDKWTKK